MYKGKNIYIFFMYVYKYNDIYVDYNVDHLYPEK